MSMVFGMALAMMFLSGIGRGAEAPGASAGTLIAPAGHYGYLHAYLIGNYGVHYEVDNVDPNADFTIEIEDTKTGAEEKEDEHSDDHGHFHGSHAMANPFVPGTTVLVSLVQNGKVIDYQELQVPEHVPWWAYTGIGTAIYFLF